MTNAEKYQEVFGFPPDKGCCPAERCEICPGHAEECLCTFKWWDEEYKGGADMRPHGEWIDHSDEGYVECPFCGSATNCEDNKDELHYCWNCGAEMRQEETTDE